VWGQGPRFRVITAIGVANFASDYSKHRQARTAHPLLYNIVMKALSLILSLPLVACVVGPGGSAPVTGGDDDGSDMNTGSGSNTGSGTSGHITADATWTGTHMIDSSVTIDPGVTVTAAAGGSITFTAAGNLTVAGTLSVEGTKGSTVSLVPDVGLANFNPINVSGTLKMTYAEMNGGWLSLSSTATTTITDSTFSHATHDLVVMDGGTISFMYSQVGVEAPSTDTTHCDLHFGGTAPVIKASHSTFSTSTYGVMFYAGNNADFTYDNWMGNQTNVDPTPGQVTGDFSYSFFDGAAPTITGLTATNMSATRLVACDGTNDAMCAGPR
jgi:hypothetical protein